MKSLEAEDVQGDGLTVNRPQPWWPDPRGSVRASLGDGFRFLQEQLSEIVWQVSGDFSLYVSFL